MPHLSLFEQHVITELQSDRLGKTFTMYCGLSQQLAEQLVQYSNNKEDEALHTETQDARRFAALDAYCDWYESDDTRFVYAFVDSETETLAGLIWFRADEFPHDGFEKATDLAPEIDEKLLTTKKWSTAGVRSYPPYRGVGLARPFLQTALHAWKETGLSEAVIFGTFPDNAVSIALYQKCGAVQVGTGLNKGEHKNILVSFL